MIGAVLFISGVSLIYINLLKCTSGNHVTIDENDKRRKITAENKKNKHLKKPKNCSW